MERDFFHERDKFEALVHKSPELRKMIEDLALSFDAWEWYFFSKIKAARLFELWWDVESTALITDAAAVVRRHWNKKHQRNLLMGAVK